MSTFSSTNKKLINCLYLILIVLFSFFINWKYSRYGVFPIDTFLHYDSAYRILNGEYPIRDYWVVSGIFIDFLQALFFKIFSVNWYAYIIHSSLFNVIISILTFYILIKLNLKKRDAFLYSISFSLLAYPVSGTPFTDLHATFFCVIAIYFTFLAVENPKINLNWILIVLFYFISFFSKQVPAAYLIILNTIIILPYLLVSKNFKPLIVIFFSLSVLLLLTFVVLNILNIDLSLFYIQYIDYPRSIGSERLNFLSVSIKSIFNHYKFILIPVFFLIYLKLKKLLDGKINFFSSEFVNFLIFLSLCLSLFLHQTLTKNQIYIYFLIPLSFAFLHIEIKKLSLRFKNLLIYLIIFLLIFSSTKYHIRFNENRKFHELVNTDISKSVKSITIHNSLRGILWISPIYKGKPEDEIQMLKKIQYKIEANKNEIMVITNYLFLDSITSKNLNSPSRAHTTDGTNIPIPNSKYFDYYKNYFKQKLIKKNIKDVYFIKSENIPNEIFTQFFEKTCYSKFEDDIFIFFRLNQVCLN